uniref:Uncharacterized protein n=1 Tax=Cacopsylla melanoneura TaxID=428564 RepID=A0A8D8SXQ7_9HEMI
MLFFSYLLFLLLRLLFISPSFSSSSSFSLSRISNVPCFFSLGLGGITAGSAAACSLLLVALEAIALDFGFGSLIGAAAIVLLVKLVAALTEVAVSFKYAEDVDDTLGSRNRLVSTIGLGLVATNKFSFILDSLLSVSSSSSSLFRVNVLLAPTGLFNDSLFGVMDGLPNDSLFGVMDGLPNDSLFGVMDGLSNDNLFKELDNGLPNSGALRRNLPADERRRPSSG